MKIFNLANKKIILSILAVILFGTGFYLIFLKERKPEFTLVEVVRGNIVQEIFESGQVARGEKVSLGFKSAGRVEKIHVKVGDEVGAGQELAKLNVTDLEIQLQEARISLELAQLNLNKLLAGASPEEIKIAETQVESARVSLSVAKENLENSYQVALTVLDGSYPQIYNALDFSRELVKEYIIVYDEDARKIMRFRDEIERVERDAKNYLEIAKKSLKREDIEIALSIMNNSLGTSFNNLETIRQIIDRSAVYYGKVSAADKTSLDLLKTNVNSALGKVISSQQTISLMKLNFQTVEKALKEAENRLALVKTEARQVDIDLYQTQIRQTESRVRFYENQIKESNLVSPIDGKVIEIRKRVGELAQPTMQDAVLAILPLIPYGIKADIYEEDVVKIDLGNPVEISLVAFPGRIFKGSVVSINPAEKLVEGVVYYEAIISFEENIESLRPGMTADLVIVAGLKENVLIIPRQALQRKEGRIIVEVLKEGEEVEERIIEIGARGVDDMVEIISGLERGEKIIVY